MEKTLFLFLFLAAKLCSKTIGLLLSPSFPRVARRNRKRQPRKRRVHTGRRRGKKQCRRVIYARIGLSPSDRLPGVVEPSAGTGPATLWAGSVGSSTWQINEHVLLLVIKLKLAHLPEGTDVVSVRAVHVMAVEIHVSVAAAAAAAAAAAISLMWHICGSWWRWSVSSAPRIYFFAVLSPLPPRQRSSLARG